MKQVERKYHLPFFRLVFIVMVFPIFFSAQVPYSLQTQETEKPIQEKAMAINVEVPVRVFKGDTFIDDLTLDDFELYEEGELQKIEAVYLIKKTNIEKAEIEKEGGRRFSPKVSRNFVFIFSMYDYLPKINDVLDYFFGEIFLPGDTLNVATPTKTYNLSSKAISEKVSPKEIEERMKLLLRRDIEVSSGRYKALMQELEYYALQSEEDSEIGYIRTLREFQQLRFVDLRKLEEFASYLKAKEGQKHVFLFYQQEKIPLYGEYSGRTDAMVEIYDPTRPEGMTLASQSYITDILQSITFNAEKIKNMFADSSISAHFLYITKPVADSIDMTRMGSSEGLRYREITEDVFNAFLRIAEDTGGIVDSSANASAAFKKAAYASENYYLLYYSPKNYIADGKFKNIKVKVKGKSYKVTYRAGYIAD
jgi:hypothetical protein